MLHRMFPFDRGLFEDKVANIWCSLSIVPGLKLHQRFETSVLLRVSTATTLLMLAPSAVALLVRPPRSARSLPLALLNSSLAFFLASFQVHEKSLLLALLPIGMLLPTSPLLFGWFSVLGAFSMYPLLVKDGLVLPYAVCQVCEIHTTPTTCGCGTPCCPTSSGRDCHLKHIAQTWESS